MCWKHVAGAETRQPGGLHPPLSLEPPPLSLTGLQCVKSSQGCLVQAGCCSRRIGSSPEPSELGIRDSPGSASAYTSQPVATCSPADTPLTPQPGKAPGEQPGLSQHHLAGLPSCVPAALRQRLCQAVCQQLCAGSSALAGSRYPSAGCSACTQHPLRAATGTQKRQQLSANCCPGLVCPAGSLGVGNLSGLVGSSAPARRCRRLGWSACGGPGASLLASDSSAIWLCQPSRSPSAALLTPFSNAPLLPKALKAPAVAATASQSERRRLRSAKPACRYCCCQVPAPRLLSTCFSR